MSTEHTDHDGTTFWFIAGEKCPQCEAPVATDGRKVWCGNACGWEDKA